MILGQSSWVQLEEYLYMKLWKASKPHHFQAILWKNSRSEARIDPIGIDYGYPPRTNLLLRSLLYAAGGADRNLVPVRSCFACEACRIKTMGFSFTMPCSTVDGSEIRQTHQLIMVGYPIIYRVFLHPRWLAGFLPWNVSYRPAWPGERIPPFLRRKPLPRMQQKSTSEEPTESWWGWPWNPNKNWGKRWIGVFSAFYRHEMWSWFIYPHQNLHVLIALQNRY